MLRDNNFEAISLNVVVNMLSDNQGSAVLLISTYIERSCNHGGCYLLLVDFQALMAFPHQDDGI